jgi:arginine deiminase
LRSWTVTPGRSEEKEGELRVSLNRCLWDALAKAIGVDAVTVLSTDEDIRAAEREQWDDGNNYLAAAPGVVLGYDRGPWAGSVRYSKVIRSPRCG